MVPCVNILEGTSWIQNSSKFLIIDARSPSEYHLGHIPGAVSIPILNDLERAEIGTLFKQQGREKAIRRGLEILGPQMGIKLRDLRMQLQQNPKEVMVYCWRGGLRSSILAWLFLQGGHNIHRLSGGYKGYRNKILEQLAKPRNYKVLAGCTGTGKTELLQKMHHNGQAVIDLEALAHHKGSAFGNLLQVPQPTQQQFENRLAHQLILIDAKNSKEPIWLESESQRIGLVNLPHSFFLLMQNATLVNWIRPFEIRLQRIIFEYSVYPVEKLIDAVLRMSKRLGGSDTNTVIAHLNNQNYNAAFAILLNYYDRWYLKSRKNDSKNHRCVIDVHTQNQSMEETLLYLKQILNEKSR